MTSNPPLPTNNRLFLLAIPTILLTALLARSISLQWSPLPYNIDGLSELRVTQDILFSHHLDFPALTNEAESYVSDMPILGLLSAFFCSTLGINPVDSFQLLAALLGAITVSLFFLVFRQHWNTSKGALASALVLALTGSFVFSSGCTWKESLGFVFLALALYSYPLRDQPQYRLLLGSSLLLSIFTHHHITIAAFVIVTFAVMIDLANRTSKESSKLLSRRELLDVLTVITAWTVAIVYYWHVHLPYIDYLSPSTDLYLYLAVAFLLVLVGVRLSRRDRPMTRAPIELVVPAAGTLLMAYNYVHPIFPGMPAPAGLIAVPFLAYLILVAPAWTGVQLALSKRGQTKNLLLAMLLGPLSLILFAFLRSNDATSQLIIYRTFDLVMPAFALLIGVGFAFIVKGRVRLGIAAGVSLVIVCASTLPIAYSSQELFGVENQTYWFEYDAVQWFSEHGVDSYTSDQRLGETGGRLFDLNGSRGLPYDLREGIALNGSSYFVLEAQWTKKGAQEFPFGVVVVKNETITTTLNESSVFYIGGSLDSQIVGFRTR
jgi:hypothetical protein